MKWIYFFFITTIITSAQGSLVQQEIRRGGHPYAASDRLIIAGRTHYVEKNYVAALTSYEKAIQDLIKSAKHMGPLGHGELYQNRLKSYTDHLSDAAVAVSVTQERVGKKELALKTLLNAFKYSPDNEFLVKRLDLLLKDTPTPLELHLNKVKGYMLHKQYEKAHETLGLYLKQVKAKATE